MLFNGSEVVDERRHNILESFFFLLCLFVTSLYDLDRMIIYFVILEPSAFEQFWKKEKNIYGRMQHKGCDFQSAKNITDFEQTYE